MPAVASTWRPTERLSTEEALLDEAESSPQLAISGLREVADAPAREPIDAKEVGVVC